MSPNVQLLAAHPHDPTASEQSSMRYVAISEPSTPACVRSAFASSVPCAGVSRKFLHAYVMTPRRAKHAVPSTSLDLSNVFIVPSPREKDDPLECGADAHGNRSVARINALIDAACLVADIARRAEDRDRRQCRIETLIARDREQILGLQ